MAAVRLLPGKFVWFEFVSNDLKKAQDFFSEVLLWKTVPYPMGNTIYEMIHAGDTADSMIGGYKLSKDGRPSHWISYVSVKNVDETVEAALKNGGKVIEAPNDISGVGRTAGIADQQGAELWLITSATSDAPDAPAQHGRIFWNELHTNFTAKALSFCEKVLGFTHRSMDMGAGGMYHILSQGGIDRGGVTDQLLGGVMPHWLPYVFVDDPDATLARAKKHGARVQMEPKDIPNVGRIGVFQDPTGAALAIMKPQPMAKQGAA